MRRHNITMGVFFIAISVIIIFIGIISEFTVLSAALAIVLFLVGVQIARGKMR